MWVKPFLEAGAVGVAEHAGRQRHLESAPTLRAGELLQQPAVFGVSEVDQFCVGATRRYARNAKSSAVGIVAGDALVRSRHVDEPSLHAGRLQIESSHLLRR